MLPSQYTIGQGVPRFCNSTEMMPLTRVFCTGVYVLKSIIVLCARQCGCLGRDNFTSIQRASVGNQQPLPSGVWDQDRFRQCHQIKGAESSAVGKVITSFISRE